MPSVLITGANRGIGLEFVRQYASEGWQVFACCRNPQAATDLLALDGDIQVLELDVATDASVGKLKRVLLDKPLDLLINNAGVFSQPAEEPAEVDCSLFGDVFNVNTTGAARLIGAFGENVIAAKGKIVAISSKMGSIGGSTASGFYAYRASKAAVNALVAAYAKYFVDHDVPLATLCPGWVQTDMGGANADITVTESVTGLRQVIADLSIGDTGKFYTYTGEERDW